MMSGIARYFDERADGWLAMEEHTKSPVQPAVALMAGIHEGSRVLDLGCGLGVMMPVYEQLGVARAVGVDVSSRMIDIARKRWADHPEFEFIVGDGAALQLPESFDAVVIYNAYPHFMDRIGLVESCRSLLAEGGRFVVAHGTGRDGINAHHDAVAAGVSLGLQGPAEESAVWESAFLIDALIDTPDFYGFAGALRS